MKSRTAGILVMALIVIIAVFCMTGFKGKPKEVYLEDIFISPVDMIIVQKTILLLSLVTTHLS